MSAVSQAVSRAIEAQQLATPRVIPNMGDLIDAAERELLKLQDTPAAAPPSQKTPSQSTATARTSSQKRNLFMGDSMSPALAEGQG